MLNESELADMARLIEKYTLGGVLEGIAQVITEDSENNDRLRKESRFAPAIRRMALRMRIEVN